MREIVLDTETTGLSVSDGHRIIEIGCVELYDKKPTGKTFQQYIHPQRDIPTSSFQVHGLSVEFLQTFPLFSEVFAKFIEFIHDSPLVIHNAKFDMSFLHAECHRIQKSLLHNPVVDTLQLARQKFPGSPASLDALCRRFQISLGERTHHGALLDAHLLAKVYANLCTEKELNFTRSTIVQPFRARQPRRTRSFSLSESEKKEHLAMLLRLQKYSS